jgi:hypothetical protein
MASGTPLISKVAAVPGGWNRRVPSSRFGDRKIAGYTNPWMDSGISIVSDYGSIDLMAKWWRTGGG